MADIYEKLDSGATFKLYNVALQKYVFASGDSNKRDSDKFLELHYNRHDRTEFVAKKVGEQLYLFQSTSSQKWWFRSGDFFAGGLGANTKAMLDSKDVPQNAKGKVVELRDSDEAHDNAAIDVELEPGTTDKFLLSFKENNQYIFGGAQGANGDNPLLSGENRFGDQSRFVFVWV